jgi:hypothetical protein
MNIFVIENNRDVHFIEFLSYKVLNLLYRSGLLGRMDVHVGMEE